MARDHVFVSYCQADAEAVYPDLEWLQAAGVRLWYDGGIPAGDEWAETIGTALRDSATLLAFLSPRWVGSKHCRDELTMALNRDKPLVLVHLEDAELTPGLELRLSKTQALFRHRMTESVYREKLLAALPRAVEGRRPTDEAPLVAASAAPLSLFVGPAGKPPFLPDAVVLEEDTWLVMSGKNELEWPSEHPVRVINNARSAEPEEPGTVVVRQGRPRQLLAVVHDLGMNPICTAGWVASALARTVELSARMQLGGLALPLLGTRQGRLGREAVLKLTVEALASGSGFPRRAWLVTPSSEVGAVREEVRRTALDSSTGRTIRLEG